MIDSFGSPRIYLIRRLKPYFENHWELIPEIKKFLLSLDGGDIESLYTICKGIRPLRLYLDNNMTFTESVNQIIKLLFNLLDNVK